MEVESNDDNLVKEGMGLLIGLELLILVFLRRSTMYFFLDNLRPEEV